MCIVYVPSYILHLDEKMRQVLRLIGVVVSTFGMFQEPESGTFADAERKFEYFRRRFLRTLLQCWGWHKRKKKRKIC